ncbi:ribonuclease H-like domain-containing protein [Tanacetum coccineum]|uniref:Ribonuclease H-like domain-containing protein n=1 Tax=Tanacetum coccineum TaxID=301880 RepID=A0ABQ5EXW9_9ASTR
MYPTISLKLVHMIIDDSVMAHAVWERIKDIFHDDKDICVIQLDNEIRNMSIRNLSPNMGWAMYTPNPVLITGWNMDTEASSYLVDNAAGISNPLKRMNCHVMITSLLPYSHLYALRDPNCQMAILEEYNALMTKDMWSFVPRLANLTIVHSMLLFMHKFHEDGSLSRIITALYNEFAMTDIGSLNYVLGVLAHRPASSMFLFENKYAKEILERAHMQNYNPCCTLVDTKSKLGPDGDPPLKCSLVGALQYLTFVDSGGLESRNVIHTCNTYLRLKFEEE